MFAKAREKARQASCLSNIKQLGLAALQYAQDNDEGHPLFGHAVPGAPSNGIDTGGVSSLGMILPYVNNAQVYSCPSIMPPFTRTWTGARAGLVTTSDYWFNWYYLNEGVSAGYIYGNEMLSGHDPSSVAMMTTHAGDGAVYWPWINQATRGRFEHNEGQNIVYADGHAKWENKQTIIGGFTMQGRKF